MNPDKSGDQTPPAWLSLARRVVPRDSRLRRWWRERRERQALYRLPGAQLVRCFAEAYPQAFFIQVGSNDGEQLDPLRQAILGHPWRGIMIEPVPYVFARLQKNYGRYAERIRLENYAIADRDGKLPFYHLAPVADFRKEGLPRWYDALGSFNRDVLLRHAAFIPDLPQRVVCTEVPSLSFESLCRRNGVEQVDLLHTDTEGYDFELLKMIDFQRWRPRVLIYEHLHLNDADRVACQAYLRGHGYSLLQEAMDTWCLNLRDAQPRDQPMLQLWQTFKPSNPDS